MGWLSDVGRSLNQGFNRFVNDPGKETLRQAERYVKSPNDALQWAGDRAGVDIPSEAGFLHPTTRPGAAIDFVRDFGAQGEAPPQLRESEDLSSLRNRMLEEAARYRSQLPGMQNEYSGLLRRDADRALEGGTRNVRRSASDRGMLHSGYRVADEQDLRSQVAQSMAEADFGMRGDLQKTARAKEEAAAQVGLDSYNESIRRANELADMQYNNMVARRQSLERLGKAGGYLAGYSYGNRPSPRQSATSSDGLLGNRISGYATPDPF